jgi:hypothetical protein
MTTMIELDERRRASFGKVGHKEHSLYRADVLDDGTIVLSPAVLISERELALLANPEVVASIKRGVKQAHSGKTSPVDFSVFGDSDEDDELATA